MFEQVKDDAFGRIVSAQEQPTVPCFTRRSMMRTASFPREGSGAEIEEELIDRDNGSCEFIPANRKIRFDAVEYTDGTRRGTPTTAMIAGQPSP